MFDAKEVREEAFSYYRRLARVEKLVERHFAERITLRRAAGVACLETRYFSTFFRSKTGVCFRDWLAYKRSVLAGELMGRDNISITEVGYSVGFRDLRTFERAFKRSMGMTPSAYKRTVRPC